MICQQYLLITNEKIRIKAIRKKIKTEHLEKKLGYLQRALV